MVEAAGGRASLLGKIDVFSLNAATLETGTDAGTS